MKNLSGFIGYIFILISLMFGLAIFGLTLHGLYLSFSASLVLGIIVLIAEPSPIVISLIYLAFNYNIPEHVIEFFNK
jgi:hypothetical protein